MCLLVNHNTHSHFYCKLCVKECGKWTEAEVPRNILWLTSCTTGSVPLGSESELQIRPLDDSGTHLLLQANKTVVKSRACRWPSRVGLGDLHATRHPLVQHHEHSHSLVSMELNPLPPLCYLSFIYSLQYTPALNSRETASPLSIQGHIYSRTDWVLVSLKPLNTHLYLILFLFSSPVNMYSS